jgi:hypothetical protein
MKLFAKLIPFALLVAVILLPVQSAAAEGVVQDGQAIFGQSFTLQSGDTMNGNLLVVGGSVTIEAGAKVNGSVFVTGGGVAISGEVTGDVAVIGGSVALGSSAHVHGNLTIIGSTLVRADGSQVDGEIYNAANSSKSDGSDVSTKIVKTVMLPANLNIVQGLASVFNAFSGAVALALFAMLVMLFLAPHADRVAHTVIERPLVAGGLGLLTVLGVVFLALTLILIPVAILAAIALLVAAAFGWIAIGYEVGQRFTRAIHQNWHPAFSAGAGVFALTFLAGALMSVPVVNCMSWLLPFALGLAALGAVIMTRFGTQAVAAPVAAVPEAPAASLPLPPEEEMPGKGGGKAG